MEVINQSLFSGVFKNKKILITGDSGFKGSWLAIWLKELGADVYGYSLPPKNKVDNFVLCKLNEQIHHSDGDIRDLQKLKSVFDEVKPDIAFHLAAQPIVLESYENPHYTFETNVIGTVNFFEAVRNTASVKAAVNITSDKCYQNNDVVWGYRENDPMGGKDPYSASKGCSEIVTNSYLHSFFNGNNKCSIASARAGNVIGGGDWADNRIIPDFFRALIKNETLEVRYPDATRPWQHVLEPLSGYLLLAANLYKNGKDFSGGWNFGPSGLEVYKVRDLIESLVKMNGEGRVVFGTSGEKKYEANILKLDISKAATYLYWKPVLNFNELINFTLEGYIAQFAQKDLYTERVNQIKGYCNLAQQRNCYWNCK